MHLFERINQRDITVASTVANETPLTFRDFRRAARDSVRVVADDCAEWMAAGDQQRWGSAKEHNPMDLMGPLRLPFDSMWIEWSFPSWSQTDGTRFAAWVTADDPDADTPDGCAQVLTFVVLCARGKDALYTPVWTYLFVDEQGTMLGLANNVDPASDSATRARSWTLVPSAAIGFMNCRNIEVNEHLPAERRRRPKRGGPKIPDLLSHHVISLPRSSRPRNLNEAREAAGDAIPLHLVRGHFKTYTAEAPLLGRHVGTYWWHPTVRGLQENGRVAATYRVSPPQDHH
ncbi:hypothetical protein [Nocardia noduli]|uniref:hypothetical protein n=1 Tax=Nocardia noduli TaxID=2815722 RepID=UPI001C21F41E|nr:hypothetical protein [Nocardia noduli]